MDRPLQQTIQDLVNSRTKLDVLYYFHHNPYACESLAGLSQRLHRSPDDLENAVEDLARHGLLVARSPRGGASELVFSFASDAARAPAVARLMEAYDGPQRRAILQSISEQDSHTRLRLVAQQRVLDDLRTRFVSMVTHELRTPVTVIKSVLKALRASKQITDEQLLSLLERGERQSERLSSIVENLLVLSGLQTGGGLELYMSEVDLPRLVGEVCDRFDSATRAQLQTSLLGAPPTVVGDEYLLGQLLEELVNNALKFGPEHAPVLLEVTEEEGHAVIAIEDEGVGVSSHQHERLFDPFFQGQADSSRATGGMGLGLFLSRKIVESHGGTIWVEAKPPPGTRVCFSIPLLPPEG